MNFSKNLLLYSFRTQEREFISVVLTIK